MSRYDIPEKLLNVFGEFTPTISSNLIRANVLVVDELENQDVHRIGISSRNCRFPQENQNMRIHNYYSRKTCIRECAEEQIMMICNCTLPLEVILDQRSRGVFQNISRSQGRNIRCLFN